jgi:uncharacterized membrane protein YidH (DUF202 family)
LTLSRAGVSVAELILIQEHVPMRPLSVIGIVLIILGILALAYQGITYTTKEKIVDIGPVQATAKKEKTMPLPPVLGGLALVAGVVLVIVGARR